MKILSMPARLAATGAATALAAAGLVAAGSVSANAATGANVYQCVAAAYGVDHAFPVTVETSALPSGSVPAAADVAPGAFEVTEATITIPAELAPLLGGLGVDGAVAPDFAFELGDKARASAPLTISEIVPGEGGTLVGLGSGTSTAFRTPVAGTHDITMPEAFTFVPTIGGESPGVEVPCTNNDEPAKLGEITTTKQASTMDAKAAKTTVKRTAKAKLIAKVTREFGGAPATGKVIAKKGSKKVGSGSLKQGKATFTIDKLKVGKHTITLSYKGDAATTGSSDKVTIKVVK